MAQAKRASKGKHPSKAASVLGISPVMSLAASTGGSPADILPAFIGDTDCRIGSRYTMAECGARLRSQSRRGVKSPDVSLATPYLYDKENPGKSPVRRTARFPIRLRWLRTRLRRLRAAEAAAAFEAAAGFTEAAALASAAAEAAALAFAAAALAAAEAAEAAAWASAAGRRLLLVLGRLRLLLDWSAVLLS